MRRRPAFLMITVKNVTKKHVRAAWRWYCNHPTIAKCTAYSEIKRLYNQRFPARIP